MVLCQPATMQPCFKSVFANRVAVPLLTHPHGHLSPSVLGRKKKWLGGFRTVLKL